MIKNNADLMKGLDVFTSRQQAVSQKAKAVTAAPETQLDAIHIEKSERQSFTFFYRSVHSRVEQHLESKQQKLEKELAEKQLQQAEKRSDVAANNILKFIEHQLTQDVKDGASLVAMESRIKAALDGFEQGYEEATETLKEMDLFSAGLAKEIDMTKDKVLAGIEQFKHQFLETEPAPKQEEKFEQDDSATTSVPTQTYQQGINVGQMNDFSFELTTADGDRVTVNSSAIQAYAQQSGYRSQSAANGAIEMAYQSFAGYQESNFSFSVDGELDQQELEAINNLLNNVNDLAADFYNGDVNKAFEKAVALNYDASEISEFSVSLTQIKHFTAYQAYQTDKPLFNPRAINELKPLAEFSNQLRDSFTSLKPLFEQPKSLMNEVLASVNQLHKPTQYPLQQPDFAEFASRLLDKFEPLMH